MRRLLAAAFLGMLLTGTAGAQDTQAVPYGSWKQLMINGPACLTWREAWEGGTRECANADYEAWLADIRHWRQERRIRIGYDPARYADPRLAWTRTSFVQTQMMVEDRYFYDPVAGRYTVDRYLDDLTARFGGIDAVLLWPDYPNMGIDDRNQLDQVANLPGGLPAVKAMVADFHRRGVRVLLPMMMWDQGTRAPDHPWPQAIAEMAREIGIDGINGDTQDGVPLAFSLAADKTGHPLAFQPEGVLADEAVAWDLMSWGQYTFAPVPKVDRYKWLEPRHMVNISDRWARDKTDDLHYAFFNGVGWEAWENVWGIWNGISARDGEAMRRVATLERGLGGLLSSPDWQPFYPTRAAGVYASRWPGADGRVAWTIVNRNDHPLDQTVLAVPADGAASRYFDLYHGVELVPRREGGQLLLSFPLEAQGFGAVLALPDAPDAATRGLMARMKALTATDLASLPRVWAPLPQRLVDIPATVPAVAAPDGMVEIPAGNFTFRVQGLEIEGGTNAGVDVAYPWEGEARRYHEHRLSLPRFFMDRFPVTNAQFKRFLDASGYHPRDDRNFLKDWKGGTYPAGWDDRPVTWVSQEDARAYAAWAGKRLPHEWEWQYAAQGRDGRRYPWGDTWRDDAVPVPERGRAVRPPDAVGAHPAGASPFGVQDLVGNVWQWTDEYQDEHTRAAILRGGSLYQPQGSIWYFPQAYRNDQHGKLLLMAPSRDRSALVGFRCVKDAA
ncbi:formylglycine-generating enzyme family protein [Nitrospirillum viridazoti]|uniref:Sulfatase-modifying factor protein n=1 Tax=Nitrospirillum viridazoti CBAmc TaxID=1441467 RepID=A0A248JYC9_9PROT|nr:SUMF1/EgtB/PvdO family nonheme iron enzyme [Nitrospirillum amazonense]ASG23713.1 sulfatase-modifying factor protein [Nitrospirillum amazonense CBAmc]TWB44894.1 formylglycine-generating enzyme required for sulfatase activity [Nitrospirillum amazonense]